MDVFSRTQLLFGADAMEKLKHARVAVFGVGGVGGHAVEALARSGVGHIELCDNDQVSITNVNRQLVALLSTVGRDKVDVMAERILDINPECEVVVHKCFYLPGEAQAEFDFSSYDYVIDAIDTVSGKIGLICQASENQVPVISSMGAGNKLNPAMFEVADIYDTAVDPLAKVMRRELKKRGIKACKVVYSKELPLTPLESEHEIMTEESMNSSKRAIPGSTAFVPSVVGLIIASEVIKDLSGVRNDRVGM